MNGIVARCSGMMDQTWIAYSENPPPLVVDVAMILESRLTKNGTIG
jgi:hypothetical protein